MSTISQLIEIPNEVHEIPYGYRGIVNVDGRLMWEIAVMSESKQVAIAEEAIAGNIQLIPLAEDANPEGDRTLVVLHDELIWIVSKD